jgi:tRNA-specific 2-thiouridylase
VTADKKDSMGICFVGKVGIRDFLKQYVSEKPGKIIDQTGREVGEHDGAIFYTIGQRHGLETGGGMPYYVTGKSMKKNEVYVTTDLQDDKLWGREVRLADSHWINGPSPSKRKLAVRLRHRAKLISVKLLNKSSNSAFTAELDEDVRALTPGQSAVFYSGRECIGGGIVI